MKLLAYWLRSFREIFVPRRIVFVIVFIISAGVAITNWRAVDGWNLYRPLHKRPTLVDREVSQRFLATGVPDGDRYLALFGYFLHGFIANAAPDWSLIHYPGLPSLRGYAVSGLEGFARTAPMFGAWIYSGRSPLVTDPQTGKVIDLVSTLRSGILAGVDPSSPGYWGRMSDNDQRIVEAADIARLLWLTRREIWFKLDNEEKSKIASWLLQVDSVKITTRNTWILFPVTVHAFFGNVGFASAGNYENYFEFKRNYLERGWFRDGPTGEIDYYNAWGIPYELYWIHLMDPHIDAAFMAGALNASGDLTSHLVSPAGLPMMGRSICYRTAVPSAVVAASFLSPSSISPGLARRAMDVTWRYFVGHGVLRDGTLTMGYTGTDPRIVDYYSGPGSCHWGLRSLTLAYMAEPSAPFWSTPYAPLPVEIHDYQVDLPKIGWIVRGDSVSKNIRIMIPANHDQSVKVKQYWEYNKLFEMIFRRVSRPENFDLKYRLSEYDAIPPFDGLLATPN
jgi:hypothetical protein